MSKGRGNNLLGVGGQRKKVSKSAMRGAAHGRHGLGGGHDPLATKREILRKLRENAVWAEGGKLVLTVAP